MFYVKCPHKFVRMVRTYHETVVHEFLGLEVVSIMVQTTVDFSTGGRVNVLRDYKKM